jgi:hypothetical protein
MNVIATRIDSNRVLIDGVVYKKNITRNGKYDKEHRNRYMKEYRNRNNKKTTPLVNKF